MEFQLCHHDNAYTPAYYSDIVRNPKHHGVSFNTSKQNFSVYCAMVREVRQNLTPILACVKEIGDGAVSVSFMNETVCGGLEHIQEGLDYDHGHDFELGHKMVAQGVIWFFALFAIFGNLGVILHCLPILLRDFKKLAKAEKVHRWLVLNLAVSDLLMGIYISMYGLAHQDNHGEYGRQRKEEWLASASCTAMGVLSFISSQMSVTMLVIITSFRLASVVTPFNDERKQFRLAVSVTFASWTIWIALAALPILPVDGLMMSFDNLVKVKDASCFDRDTVPYQHLAQVVDKSRSFLREVCGYAETRTSWKDMGQKLGLINETRVNVYGYYNQQGVCTAKYLVAFSDRSFCFTLVTVVLFNLASFVYIVLAYTAIWRNTSRSGNSNLECLSCLRSNSASPSFRRSCANATDARNRENRDIQMRIVFVIVTDFLCWIPLCLIALFVMIKSSTYKNDYHLDADWRRVMPLITLALLPINSALNPFIYSFHYWKMVRVRFVDFFKHKSPESASNLREIQNVDN